MNEVYCTYFKLLTKVKILCAGLKKGEKYEEKN